MSEGSVTAEEAAEWESEIAREFTELSSSETRDMEALEAEEALRVEEVELQRQIEAYEARPGTPDRQTLDSEDFAMDDMGMELDKATCVNCGFSLPLETALCGICGVRRVS